jgi:hypothetical protein
MECAKDQKCGAQAPALCSKHNFVLPFHWESVCFLSKWCVWKEILALPSRFINSISLLPPGTMTQASKMHFRYLAKQRKGFQRDFIKTFLHLPGIHRCRHRVRYAIPTSTELLLILGHKLDQPTMRLPVYQTNHVTQVPKQSSQTY